MALVAENAEKEKDQEVIDLGEIEDVDLGGTDEGFEVGEDLPDFEVEEGDEPVFDTDGEGPSIFEMGDVPDFGGVPSAELDEAMEKVTQLGTTVEHVDSTLAVIKRTNEETVEKVNTMETTLARLTEIYQKITSDMGGEVIEEVIIEEVEESIPGEVAAAVEEMMPQEAPVELPVPAPTSTPGDEVQPLPAVREAPIPQPLARGRPGIYLKDIPSTPTSIVFLLRWLEYLLQKVGPDGLMEVLMYYEDIGWIGGDIRNTLIKYSRGVTLDEEPELPTGQMEVEDHIISLFFISKLQGIEVSPSLYSSVIKELDSLGLLE